MLGAGVMEKVLAVGKYWHIPHVWHIWLRGEWCRKVITTVAPH